MIGLKKKQYKMRSKPMRLRIYFTLKNKITILFHLPFMDIIKNSSTPILYLIYHQLKIFINLGPEMAHGSKTLGL